MLQDVGRPLEEVETPLELLRAILGVLIGMGSPSSSFFEIAPTLTARLRKTGHGTLYHNSHILHRNISTNNILVANTPLPGSDPATQHPPRFPHWCRLLHSRGIYVRGSASYGHDAIYGHRYRSRATKITVHSTISRLATYRGPGTSTWQSGVFQSQGSKLKSRDMLLPTRLK